MTGPTRTLGLFDTTAIVLGIVIGAGIFSFPGLVAGALGSDGLIVAAWIAGGAFAVIGALCFAELASAFPDPGGEYHFLNRAYGRSVGFMYGWARMSVIQTGSIATLSFVFGDHAQELLPLGPYGASIYAVCAIVILTAVNVAGLREAKWVQNVLASATLLGLAAMIVAGLAADGAASPPASNDTVGIGAVGFAMIFILFTYGGWNEAAYVSAEVRDGSRNIVRSLLIGLGLITLIYVLVNLAYLNVLGVEGMAKSRTLGADLMRPVLGEGAAIFVTALVLVVIWASINVTILTGARTNFAMGRDFYPFRFLAHWSGARAQPVRALLLQAAIALVLVGFGTANRDGVKTMVEYLAPVFWLFFLLVGVSVIVLRYRAPDAPRPFLVPWYPLTPIVFCLSSAYLLYASVNYTGVGATVGLIVLAAGIPFLFWVARAPDGASEAND